MKLLLLAITLLFCSCINFSTVDQDFNEIKTLHPGKEIYRNGPNGVLYMVVLDSNTAVYYNYKFVPTKTIILSRVR